MRGGPADASVSATRSCCHCPLLLLKDDAGQQGSAAIVVGRDLRLGGKPLSRGSGDLIYFSSSLARLLPAVGLLDGHMSHLLREWWLF